MILKYIGQWRAWRGVDRGLADRAFGYAVTKHSERLHRQDSVQSLPDDVSQNALAVETAMSESEGVLASGLPQSRPEDLTTQDKDSTMPQTDGSSLGERQPFDQWLKTLHVHYHSQQAPFTQKRNGWLASQSVKVSTSPLGDSGHPNPNEPKDRGLYASRTKMVEEADLLDHGSGWQASDRGPRRKRSPGSVRGMGRSQGKLQRIACSIHRQQGRYPERERVQVIE